MFGHIDIKYKCQLGLACEIKLIFFIFKVILDNAADSLVARSLCKIKQISSWVWDVTYVFGFDYQFIIYLSYNRKTSDRQVEIIEFTVQFCWQRFYLSNIPDRHLPMDGLHGAYWEKHYSEDTWAPISQYRQLDSLVDTPPRLTSNEHKKRHNSEHFGGKGVVCAFHG